MNNDNVHSGNEKLQAANVLTNITAALADPALSEQTRTALQQASALINELALGRFIESVIEERERQHSIVIAGLPESNAATPTGRATDDRSKVLAMLDTADCEQLPTTVYRMGKPGGGKPRLIKLMLPTRWAVRRLLQCKKKITDVHQVSIRPSQTLEERNRYKNLIITCRNARSKGQDFVIYSNVVILRDIIPQFRLFMRDHPNSPNFVKPIDTTDFASFASV